MEGRFGATFHRWRAPEDNYILPVNTFAIVGRRKIAKDAFGAQGGGHGPVPPAYAPAHTC